MTFEEDMDRFFKGQPQNRRSSVEADSEYKKAALRKDAVKAQEIASELLFGTKWMPGVSPFQV